MMVSRFYEGRGARTRTADPRVPNAVRYQLRYTPIPDYEYTVILNKNKN